MNASTRDTITWILGTGLSLAAVLGISVRFILLPYMREHLVQPMKQVQKQVTENHHHNAEPTVLDRIDDVQQSVGALTRVIDGHLDWSEKWVDLIEREIALLRREAGTEG